MRNACIAVLLAIALALFFGFDNSRPVSLREEEEEDTLPATKALHDSAEKFITPGSAEGALQ